MKGEVCLLVPDFFSYLNMETIGANDPKKEVESIVTRMFKFVGPYRGFETELLYSFGLDALEKDNISYLVSIMAEHDLKTINTRSILRADPVFLKADQNRVFLIDGQTMDIERCDADKIVLALNEFFGNDSEKFTIGKKPWRWYLTGSNFETPKLSSPFSLKGQALEPTLSQSQKMGSLKTFWTELQMFLHASDLNLARMENGKLPVNSLWFWGGEYLTSTPTNRRYSLRLMTDCEMTSCFAQYFKVQEITDLEALYKTKIWTDMGDILIVFDPFCQERKHPIYKEMIDRILALLLSGPITKLRVISRHGRFLATASSRFKFWTRGRKFRDILKHFDESGEILF